MTSILYMAWCYLAHHRVKTAVLVASITLIVYVPAGLRVLVQQSRQELRARAEATPLLLGARGSPLELVLSSLYFGAEVPATMRFVESGRVAESGLALPIPLNARFRSQGDPIVGTSLDYFEFRGLRVAAGRLMTHLGDCVVGAGVARRRGIGPGDHVISSPENAFDLAGVYPLRMRVAGVLARADGPDDDAIFVDVKTAWIIEGRAHGHQDLARPEAAPGVLRREGDRIIANEAVVQYNEITDDNAASFHFHGDPATFPMTAVIAVPHDRKSATILMGRYQDDDAAVQIVRPAAVMDELLGTVLTIERFVVAALVSVGVATLAAVALVFVLSVRLRRREIVTMVKIGGSRARIGGLLAAEIVLVVGLSAALAGTLTWATARYASDLTRAVLVSRS